MSTSTTLRPVPDPPDPLGDYAIEEALLAPREPSPPRPAPAIDDPRHYWLCGPGLDGWPQTKRVWGLWLDGAVLFAVDAESVVADDPRRFGASVVHADPHHRNAIVDGVVERVEDPAVLGRFCAACEAKYGFRIDADDPDTPVYAVQPRVDLGWEADDVAQAMAMTVVDLPV